MQLPYWNSEMDLEIAPWFPLGVDYQPVSILCGPHLQRLARACLSLESELLLMASPRLGCVGSLARDSLCRLEPPKVINLGFMMLLGWSAPMERTVAATVMCGEGNGLLAGITLCSLWNRGVFWSALKTIAIVSEGPFFDEGEIEEETGFLHQFSLALLREAKPGIPFFAEQFGYQRFSMLYDGGDPLQFGVSHRLCEMEFPETRAILGPSPEIPFPPFAGAVSLV